MFEDQPDSQLLKGTLPLAILALLKAGDSYGYKMVDDLHGVGLVQASSGSIYPLIARLAREGAIESYLKPSPSGPARKYYRITPQGLEQLEVSQTRWNTLCAVVARLLDHSESTPRSKEAK
ncbi:MAG: PadR family transcriptional regulator [Propionibacteriaceae bacterium]|nr:PadR family transcriptional regulator [Propionibacteriaceae bacterium]